MPVFACVSVTRGLKIKRTDNRCGRSNLPWVSTVLRRKAIHMSRKANILLQWWFFLYAASSGQNSSWSWSLFWFCFVFVLTKKTLVKRKTFTAKQKFPGCGLHLDSISTPVQHAGMHVCQIFCYLGVLHGSSWSTHAHCAQAPACTVRRQVVVVPEWDTVSSFPTTCIVASAGSKISRGVTAWQFSSVSSCNLSFGAGFQFQKAGSHWELPVFMSPAAPQSEVPLICSEAVHSRLTCQGTLFSLLAQFVAQIVETKERKEQKLSRRHSTKCHCSVFDLWEMR